MSAENTPKVRTRRRHLPTGVVVEKHFRSADGQVSTNQRSYESARAMRVVAGRFEAVNRR